VDSATVPGRARYMMRRAAATAKKELLA
jgi:hypothetical protein